MWSGHDKVWIHYENDSIASDSQSASFLESFTYRMHLHGTFVLFYEIIDLQRYKIIKKPALVNNSLYKINTIPFVFLHGKN